MIWLCFLAPRKSCHNCLLKTWQCGNISLLALHFIAAVFSVKELAIFLEATAESRCLSHPHLLHPDGDKVSPEFFTVKLDVQQPVILQRFKGQRHIEKVVAVRVINAQQFLCLKEIRTIQHQHLGIFQLDFLQLVLKLLVIVVPDDNAAFVELRQRLRKAAIKFRIDFLCIHQLTSS